MRTLSLALLGLSACSVDPDTADFASSAGSDGSSGDGTSSSTSSGEEPSSSSDNSTADDDGPGAEDDAGPKLDVAPGGDLPTDECACGADFAYSYIWVANSAEGTVSKIDTTLLVEEARYRTHPSGGGSPSRTSVSLSGRMMAVANRFDGGGVTAILARPELCDEGANGVAGLQTSSGANDVLAWGSDDCVAWHTPLPTNDTNRPVAWIAGTQDARTCTWSDEHVWTSACDHETDTVVHAYLLDGATGAILEDVPGGLPCDWYGAYGGAVDGDGNLWLTSFQPNTGGGSTLARIDRVTLQAQTWAVPQASYGITVDGQGRPWLSANFGSYSGSSVVRFDPTDETFVEATNLLLDGQSGLAADDDGRIWLGYAESLEDASGGIAWVDAETVEVGGTIALPGALTVKGVSVDRDGYVWAVAFESSQVFRLDPSTMDVQIYAGVDEPYTYSDMTGGALQSVSCQPRG